MIIDRIEGDIAVVECDDGSFTEFALSRLPKGAREGSVLVRCGDGFILDTEKENSLRQAAAERTRSIFKKK